MPSCVLESQVWQCKLLALQKPWYLILVGSLSTFCEDIAYSWLIILECCELAEAIRLATHIDESIVINSWA